MKKWLMAMFLATLAGFVIDRIRLACRTNFRLAVFSLICGSVSTVLLWYLVFSSGPTITYAIFITVNGITIGAGFLALLGFKGFEDISDETIDCF